MSTPRAYDSAYPGSMCDRDNGSYILRDDYTSLAAALLECIAARDREIEDLCEVIATPQDPAAPAWMPIETAPKDGKESLFCTEELGLVVMYWDDCEGKWETGFDVGDILTPTHWMPLPETPRSAA